MQTTLDRKKGYNDGIECCFDDYAEFAVELKDELEEQLGFEVNYPIIIEDDDSPCPDECPVIQGIADPDDECPHCSLLSLTMGSEPPYLRKRVI